MGSGIRLHTLHGSPNNMKVRIALGIKGLDYETIPLGFDAYPGDRSSIVEVSRQPLTPVLVHGDRVMFDSGAILRYLEANFPETTPIFSNDFQTMHEIERWEWMARAELGEPVGMVFGEAFAPEKSDATCRKASALLHELTGSIEKQLSEAPFLLGDRATAADITAVPYLYYSMLSEDAAASGPIAKFFFENFHLGDNRDRTREWVGRVMAYDAGMKV